MLPGSALGVRGRLPPRVADVAYRGHRRVCCRVGIASGIDLLWKPWLGVPKAYRIFVAMPALPQLKRAPSLHCVFLPVFEYRKNTCLIPNTHRDDSDKIFLPFLQSNFIYPDHI